MHQKHEEMCLIGRAHYNLSNKAQRRGVAEKSFLLQAKQVLVDRFIGSALGLDLLPEPQLYALSQPT